MFSLECGKGLLRRLFRQVCASQREAMHVPSYGATCHTKARQIPTVGYHKGETGLLLDKTIKKQQGKT